MQAKILQNLDHPHILRIFSWYEDGDSINIAAALGAKQGGCRRCSQRCLWDAFGPVLTEEAKGCVIAQTRDSSFKLPHAQLLEPAWRVSV